jgi:hypothetical protein
MEITKETSDDIGKQEWDAEVKRLFDVITTHSKAKEYAKAIDEFLRTSQVNKEIARTIAIGGGVRIILRDIAVLMEKRNIKLQRGMDSILKEVGDKWKSVIRNSTEMGLRESDAIPLLVSMSGAISPEFGKALKQYFGGESHEESQA